MKRLIQWHKDRMNCVANHFELSAYQCYWIAWAKGVIIGVIVAEYII